MAPVSGAIVESHRIGLFAVPFDKVLPGAGTSCFERGAWPTPKAAAGGVLAETFSEDNNTSREQTLADAGYTGGFVTCGGPKKSQTGGLVMLMETHDEVRAKVMINKLFISLGGLGGKTGKVPGFPDARVIVKKTAGTYYLDAWVSSGRMVTYVAMNSTKEQDALATTGKAFAAQQPLTAKFVPTDYDKLGLLDDDPHLLDGRTVDAPGNPSWNAGGYTAEGWRVVSDAPEREVPILKRWRTKEVYLRDGLSSDTVKGSTSISLTLTPDAHSAAGLAADELKLAKSLYPDVKPTAFPKIRSIGCLAGDYKGTYTFPLQVCIFAAKQYVVYVSLLNGTAKPTDMAPLAKVINAQLTRTPR